MPQHPIRVAVLECDTPIPSIRERYGSYRDIFEKLLVSGDRLTFSKWDVAERQIYPELEDVDALLLTEANVDGDAEEPWVMRLIDFIRQAHQRRIPIIAVCFGHQLVARALGATVKRGEAYEISATKIELTPSGASLFGDRAHLTLHQMHRDIVQSVPANCQNIASTMSCPVHGLYQKDRILTLQGHPEFDQFMVEQAASSRAEQGILSAEVAADGLARAGLEHDGGLVAQAIARFLLDARAD